MTAHPAAFATSLLGAVVVGAIIGYAAVAPPAARTEYSVLLVASERPGAQSVEELLQDALNSAATAGWRLEDWQEAVGGADGNPVVRLVLSRPRGPGR